MKNKIKFVGIIAVLGIIVFGFIACDTGNTHSHTWGDWVPSSVWGMETKACSGCAETSGLRLAAAMMADIPGGNVDLSSSYMATLTAFKMSKYEVTQAQYAAVMGDNPSYFTTVVSGEEQGKRPVESVSWYDAVEFCNALSKLEGLSPAYMIDKQTLDSNNGNVSDPYKWSVSLDPFSDGYRLPTEAQWEYACRAGSTGDYSKDINGNEVNSSNIGNYAWYATNSDNKTHEVGKQIENKFELYDMHGNVFECCWDWYGTYPGGTETDPEGPSSGSYRVIRGGGWHHSAANAASSSRYNVDPYIRSDLIGFRLVRP